MHLSTTSSFFPLQNFCCALTRGVPPTKGSRCYLQSLPYASLVSRGDSAPSCTHQATLMHSDTFSGATQVPLASGTKSLSICGQGSTQSEKNGTRLLTPRAHWWLPGWPCSCLGIFFHGECFFHWDVTMLAATPALSCAGWCISAGNSDKRVISPLLLKELTRKVNNKKKI